MSYLTDRAGLEGKVAVVTGGAGGLGWPISRDFARAGMHVAVCDRDPEATEQGRMRRQVAVPFGRYGTGEDLTGCVLFLASNLSSYVTGATLHVDGGTFASSGWFKWPEGSWDNRLPPRLLDVLVDGL